MLAVEVGSSVVALECLQAGAEGVDSPRDRAGYSQQVLGEAMVLSRFSFSSRSGSITDASREVSKA